MRAIRILIIPAIALTLAACNTVAGVGTDMQRAGAAVNQEARQTEAGL